MLLSRGFVLWLLMLASRQTNYNKGVDADTFQEFFDKYFMMQQVGGQPEAGRVKDRPADNLCSSRQSLTHSLTHNPSCLLSLALASLLLLVQMPTYKDAVMNGADLSDPAVVSQTAPTHPSSSLPSARTAPLAADEAAVDGWMDGLLACLPACVSSVRTC